MNWLSAVGVDIRSTRKCFSISGSLLLMLLLFISQTSCRPPDELYDSLDATPDEYADVDNVEYHHVKIVDGVMHEDHPIIMYKEDFVSEDYVPSNLNSTANHANETNATTTTHPVRKYKDIANRRRRQNRTDSETLLAIKPEKIYFDILSQTPLVVADDSSMNDSKFDSSKVRVEVISLANKGKQNEELDTNADEDSKQLLSKRPKKYRRRQRRDADTHVVQKRNPYYQIGNRNTANNVIQTHKSGEYVKYHQKHPVEGNLWNSLNLPVEPGLSFDDRFGAPDETDRVYWGAPARPKTTRRPRPDIFHISNPEEADYSFFTTRRPITTTTRRKRPSIFHNSNPNNADFSFLTQEQAAPGAAPPALGGPPPQAAFGKSAIEDTFNRFDNGGLQQQQQEKNSNALCMEVAKSCCVNVDFAARYECFHRYDCMRSISTILSLCN